MRENGLMSRISDLVDQVDYLREKLKSKPDCNTCKYKNNSYIYTNQYFKVMAQYDPNKKYSWSNDDKITISGRDFGLFLNAFRSILNTEEAAKILLANKANEAVEAIIAEYVEKDVIKEAGTPKPNQEPTMKISKGKS